LGKYIVETWMKQ